MIKRGCILLFMGLLLNLPALPLSAQHASLDSLKQKLNTAGLSDSMRMEVLLQLGWDYAFVSPDSARIVLYQCLELALRHKKNIPAGTAFSYIGHSFYVTDHYDSALHYYEKAEEYYKKDTSAEARIDFVVNRMSMGTLALQRGQHQAAIASYLLAIDSLNKSNSPEKWTDLVTAYANMGLIYNDLKQFGKALQYHRKALDICYAQPIEKNKTVQVQLFMALDHLNLKDYSQAGSFLDKADSLVKVIGTGYISAIFYGIQARYFKETKDYNASIAAAGQALHYAIKDGQQFQQANALQLMGIDYYELGSYDNSIRNLLQSIAISRKIGDKVRESTSLRYLSKAFGRSGKSGEAVKYYEQYIILSDSLNEADNKKQINEIENRYQAEKKQEQIVSLQKSSKLQQLEIRQKNMLAVALVAGLCFVLLAGILLYKNFQNKHRLLKQAEALHTQRISELEKERQLVAMQSVMEGQEQERSRLARDLHDGVGGLLSSVKLSLSTMKGNVYLSEENARSFNIAVSQLDQSIAELRRVSHNMMPESLIRFGLKEALEDYCENINLSGHIRVQLQTYGLENRLEQNTEIIIYRMVQELLNNVIRHADAKQVLIQFIREDDHFTLTVEDDGKGFDKTQVAGRHGAGLANVSARAAYLGGTVDIRSASGEGTSVTIEGNCS